MERDRANDSWIEADRDKPRREVLLYTTNREPAASVMLDELMAFAQPKGWRWISLNVRDPACEKPAQGAEEYAKALDDLIEEARKVRGDLDDYAIFENGDEVPTLHDLENLRDKVDEAWNDLVTRLDQEDH